MKAISIFLLVILQVITVWCVAPQVSFVVKQVFNPRYSTSFSGYYPLIFGVCAMDDILAIPCNLDNSVDIYVYNSALDMYSLFQNINGTIPQLSDLNSSNPLSCGFRRGNSEYDLIVGAGNNSGVGKMMTFIRHTITHLYIAVTSHVPAGLSSPAFLGERLFTLSDTKTVASAKRIQQFYILKYQDLTYNYQGNTSITDASTGYSYSTMYNNEVVYYGTLTSGGYTAFQVFENDSAITPLPSLNIFSTTTSPSPWGAAGGFLNNNTVALYNLDPNYSPLLYGGIDILNFDGTTWNNVFSYIPPTPVGYNFGTSTNPYRFGQSMVTNGSLIYVTSGINTLHALYYDGTNITEVAVFNNTDVNTNFGQCAGTTCNPAPLVIAGNRIFAPGSTVTWFGVTITCNSGYALSDINSCDDINECLSNTTNQCDPNRMCVNTEGSYYCTNCSAGYTNVGPYGCMDINECSNATLNQCSTSPLRQCVNTNGSYYCGPCPAGYTETGIYNCMAIDYCANSTSNNCSKNPIRVCISQVPGYICSDCPNGYSNSGNYSCVAVGPATTTLTPSTTITVPLTTTNSPLTTTNSPLTTTNSPTTTTMSGPGPTTKSNNPVSTTESNSTIQILVNFVLAVVLFLS